MSNNEVQKDLLAETKTPDEALEYAIRREKGLENQLLIRKQGSTSNTKMTTMKTEPVGFIQRRRNNNNHYPTRAARGRQSQQQRGTPKDNQQSKNNNASNAATLLARGTSNNASKR